MYIVPDTTTGDWIIAEDNMGKRIRLRHARSTYQQHPDRKDCTLQWEDESGFVVPSLEVTAMDENGNPIITVQPIQPSKTSSNSKPVQADECSILAVFIGGGVGWLLFFISSVGNVFMWPKRRNFIKKEITKCPPALPKKAKCKEDCLHDTDEDYYCVA